MATINLRNIPDNIKNRFKAICDLKNSNMTQELISLMKKTIDEEVNGRPKGGKS
ncbi:MAG: hypothetical protein JW881_16635 [Spirochaetales bacterium]|nr:hypothetical protein [Spirochaetales bacterium]